MGMHYVRYIIINEISDDGVIRGYMNHHTFVIVSIHAGHWRYSGKLSMECTKRYFFWDSAKNAFHFLWNISIERI